jgi:hypothetical protein
MTINIYFGDVSEDIATVAVGKDPRAYLIDQSNYHEFVNKPPTNNTTVYMSLGDLPKNVGEIYQVLDLADNIYFCPPANWSDNKSIDLTNIVNSMHGMSEYILYNINQQKNNVYNLDLSKYHRNSFTDLIDSRKTDNQQLWIAGCSMSHGIGVNPTQRYGQLLAEYINLPVSFLTDPGSSISWAVDQLVRSDIRSGDIVVLGATADSRFPYWTRDNKVWHVNSNPQGYKDHLPFTNLTTDIINRLITDDNCFYQSIIKIEQLINFCRKLNIKLLILGLLSSDELVLHFNNTTEFVNYKNLKFPDNYIDLGTDNQHPGPKQHQLFADFCQQTLKKLNYI